MFDGGDCCRGGRGLAHMLQQHGSGPDGPDGVGYAPARDIWGGAVYGLEEGWEALLGVDVGRRGDADMIRSSDSFSSRGQWSLSMMVASIAREPSSGT